MEMTNNLLEKYYPQFCVKAVVTGVETPFHDVIFLGDREIDLSVSNGILYAHSIISLPNGEHRYFGHTQKPLIPNYSPRMALDNARFSIFKQMESYVQDLQKNPFGQDSDSKTNREILEGTHAHNLGNFLMELASSKNVGIAS